MESFRVRRSETDRSELADMFLGIDIHRAIPVIRAFSNFALLANVAPPLLMGLFFVRREMPRIALPRWPARLADDAWPTPPRSEP